MAWIESHQSLRQHPKVIKAARTLGVSKAALIGHLHCLWWWALDYAQDGNLSAFDAADIAEAADWEGGAQEFIDALSISAKIGNKPGLLEIIDGDLCIHDWWDYAGKLIDKRKVDAERKRQGRRKEAAESSAGHPMDIAETSTGSLSPVARTVPYRTNRTNQTEPTEQGPTILQDDAEPSPEVRAIRNAYDASGLMMTKTHQDVHLLTIKQVGLINWQRGWAKAMETGKQNIPAYVARCAESEMLAAQRGSNGNGKTGLAPVPATTEGRKAYYAANDTVET